MKRFKKDAKPGRQRQQQIKEAIEAEQAEIERLALEIEGEVSVDKQLELHEKQQKLETRIRFLKDQRRKGVLNGNPSQDAELDRLAGNIADEVNAARKAELAQIEQEAQALAEKQRELADRARKANADAEQAHYKAADEIGMYFEETPSGGLMRNKRILYGKKRPDFGVMLDAAEVRELAE
ncbi:hypothetical protein [Alkalicoccus chagannorensis]|uniref:hypothetical protein n=1 Tax=Alkalicoccus chagannorensis TaxID=427072 RepID=UPI0012EC2FA5|nr:hypothetical protein [Alkalicoccus chagannorensis]